MFVVLTYRAGYENLDPKYEPRDHFFAYCTVITCVVAVLYALRFYIFFVVILQAMIYLVKKKKDQQDTSAADWPTQLYQYK